MLRCPSHIHKGPHVSTSPLTKPTAISLSLIHSSFTLAIRKERKREGRREKGGGRRRRDTTRNIHLYDENFNDEFETVIKIIFMTKISVSS